MMEQIGFLETWIINYNSTLRKIPRSTEVTHSRTLFITQFKSYGIKKRWPRLKWSFAFPCNLHVVGK